MYSDSGRDGLVMIAYVFWHWARPNMATSDYERAILQFHDALRIQKIEGLLDSFSFKLESFPWSTTLSSGYEDWYLVEDFASLGTLNEGAVSKIAAAPHKVVASYSDGGAGGIYKLSGQTTPSHSGFATWFAKPTDMPYRDLENYLGALKIPGYWQRQMVLGPAPEFCVRSSQPTPLGPKFRSTTIALRPLGKL